MYKAVFIQRHGMKHSSSLSCRTKLSPSFPLNCTVVSAEWSVRRLNGSYCGIDMLTVDVQGRSANPGAAALPVPSWLASQRQHRGRVVGLQRYPAPQARQHPDTGTLLTHRTHPDSGTLLTQHDGIQSQVHCLHRTTASRLRYTAYTQDT